MENEETSTTEPTSVDINMYPSVKEQVVTTALVSLVSIAIPVAFIGTVAAAGKLVDTVRTAKSNRKAKKEAAKAQTSNVSE